MSGLRILGGEARGRPLKSVPFDSGVRPILARIKKSLFDILKPRLSGSRFLDLYAGTGAVGLEALSRGASWVVFIELHPRWVRIIEANLQRLECADRAEVYRGDATNDLGWIGGQFDLVFLGPPYLDRRRQTEALTGKTLAALAAGSLLAPHGWIIAQHHAKEPILVPSQWEQFRQERYGENRLSFFRVKVS
ncbi:MAG: 16S rRNA (guanine(966)-N(2))-methyltransferase RsmD [Elusimicrobia bacterium]|nr:16S rRNA (guanine(966)-N(2))-methyltransferase RsmD [Elusimicrobiota bacterium]